MKKHILLLCSFCLTTIASFSFMQVVTVANFSFTPSNFTINFGDTVKWVWSSGNHTTTSDITPPFQTWNAPINSVTTTYIFVPGSEGLYSYHCNVHPSMIAGFTVACNPLGAPITASPSNSVCAGTSVTLHSQGAYPSYQWMLNNMPISGATTSDYVVTSTSGNYKCNYMNWCAQSLTSNTIAVTITTPPPSPSISAGGPTSFCKPGSVLLTVTPGAGYNIQWEKNGTSIAGQTNSTYTATKSGTYTCILSNACGILQSNLITVTSLATPQAIVTPSGTVFMCQGDTTTLVATTGNNQTYQWRKNAQLISGATNSIYKATTSGKYRVIVTKTSSGCSKTSSPTTVTINCKEPSHAQQSTVQVWPNPSNGIFNITWNGESEETSVSVFDISGRMIWQKEVAENFLLIKEPLPSGIYVIEIRNPLGLIGREKLLAQ